jgi:hypothetical protein
MDESVNETSIRERAQDGTQDYWEDNYEMFRIHDAYVDCVVYVYATYEDADKGRLSGGTGFLVRKQFAIGRNAWQFFHHYVITAKHVVNDLPGDVFVRLNNKDGQREIKRVPRQQWEDASRDDVTAAFVGFEPDKYKFLAINSATLLNEGQARLVNCGVGDFVFLVSRFVNVEGIQRNKPCVRTGSIAMMPDDDEPVSICGVERPAFLIDLRTRSGFSGSPVFLKLPTSAEMDHRMPSHNQNWKLHLPGPWLLGVHVATVPLEPGKDTSPEDRIGSGLGVVVPAWRISELLESDRFRMQRKHIEEKALKNKRKGMKLESLSKKEKDEMSKEDFANVAGRCCR